MEYILVSEFGRGEWHTEEHAWGAKHTWKPLAPEKRPGYVHVIAGGGYHKIGRAKNVMRRLAQYRAFADKRAGGEWFCLGKKDLERIPKLCKGL